VDSGLLFPEYDVLVTDPPWKHRDGLAKRGAAAKYKCMPTKAICNMALPPLAKNAWVFLWRLANMQDDAFEVAQAWDLTIKTELVWQKLTKNGLNHFGMGYYLRASHETCLVCTRGRVRPVVKNIRSTFSAKMPVEPTGRLTKKGRPLMRYIHSAKPDEFYDLVEELTGPGLQRVEMFSRRYRDGWKCMGNEAGKYGRQLRRWI
jgi:N6-adenosine-specific RNA methylase IME4